MKIVLYPLAMAWLCLNMLGCSGPFLWLPGGELSGPEVSLNSATLPAQGGVLILETQPDDPYSVNIGYTVIQGAIYIDPAAERRWYQHIELEPNVRVRLEGEEVVYPATAIKVEDQQILSLFEPDRIVLRLDAR